MKTKKSLFLWIFPLGGEAANCKDEGNDNSSGDDYDGNEDDEDNDDDDNNGSDTGGDSKIASELFLCRFFL